MTLTRKRLVLLGSLLLAAAVGVGALGFVAQVGVALFFVLMSAIIFGPAAAAGGNVAPVSVDVPRVLGPFLALAALMLLGGVYCLAWAVSSRAASRGP